jgi:acyl transferase domain-containing protein
MKTETAIAIVGFGARLPGAETPSALTDLITHGNCAIDDVPAERWLLTAQNDDVVTGLVHDRAGLVGAIDGIDRRCFRISANEAPMIDPAQRLFLETSWHALEHAGYAPSRLEGTSCGVFAGVCASEYALLQAASWGEGPENPYQNVGVSNSVVPGRVAYCLGLNGPVQAIDNACASSMTAVIAAAEAIVLGRCEFALAGGVNTLLSKRIFQSLAAMRTLSPNGVHRPFDSQADGYVRGEGCGVVVLKKLDAAIESGDTIHAVIRGWAERHNGRTNGIHAPSWRAQSEAMQSAIAMARVTPAEIAYVEAHGSATPLGDMIEARAIQEAVASKVERPVAIGSVKAAIGHLEGAAAIAGLLKAITVLKTARIPPQPGFCSMGDKLAAVAPNIKVTQTAQDWPDGAKAVLINSLGYNGACAHAVLTCGPPEQPIKPSEEAGLFLVSAACPDALRERLVQLQTCLENMPASTSITQLAQAVSTRWDGLSYRRYLYATNQNDALKRLCEILNNQAPPTRIPTLMMSASVDEVAWQNTMGLLRDWADEPTPAALFKTLGLSTVSAAEAEAGAETGPEAEAGPEIGGLLPLVPRLQEKTERGAKQAVFDALGHAWSTGVAVDLTALWPNFVGPVDVPLYPFQRTKAWALRRGKVQNSNKG